MNNTEILDAIQPLTEAADAISKALPRLRGLNAHILDHAATLLEVVIEELDNDFVPEDL